MIAAEGQKAAVRNCNEVSNSLLAKALATADDGTSSRACEAVAMPEVGRIKRQCVGYLGYMELSGYEVNTIR